MITKPLSIEELKSLFAELLINKTSKVTKISNDSAVNAVSYGIAKVGQKAMKDVALIESNIFPDSGSGAALDGIASRHGISSRFSASESSTYIRLVGDVGTQYVQGTHIFTGNHGISFDLEESVTIGAFGYTYAKVRSQSQGQATNVDPLTINTVSPTPNGHRYVVNEYAALGGRDSEQDFVFRKRVKEGANILAKGTLSAIEQAFIKINNNVLRVINQGINIRGQVILAIVTQNGIDLTKSELDELLQKGEEFFGLREIRSFGKSTFSVELKNISWQPIDISFRVDLLDSVDIDFVRKQIQIAISKELDFRFWSDEDIVQWDNLLNIVKNIEGVKYVPDTFFYPNQDIQISSSRLPRIRGFLMLDLNGNIISNLTGTLNSFYYPNNVDFSFQQTVLRDV